MELKALRKEIEDKIEEALCLLGPPSPLRDACAFALKSGGKRVRPLIVLMTARQLNPSLNATDAAVAVECCHTASLIADDLPCMDDGMSRRGHPSLHTLFSESVALLASYSLISLSFQLIGKAFSNSETLSQALQEISFATGIEGASGGQYLDLFPPSLEENKLIEMVSKKSGALFELSFVLGWLIGDGDKAKLPLLKKAASHFGLVFQLTDDWADLKEDKEKKKSNLFLILGSERAEDILKEEKRALTTLFSTLQFNSEFFSFFERNT